MKKTELALIVILRFVGVTGLFALPFVFLPFAWLQDIHRLLGLGEMPSGPVVDYLARSLSAFYALVAAAILYLSFTIDRHRDLIFFLGILSCLMGGLFLFIDLAAGMPLSWVLTEGPPTTATGALICWLVKRVPAKS